jgi:hypothetical protein
VARACHAAFFLVARRVDPDPDTIWIMTVVRIASVSAPLDVPGVAAAAFALVRRALGVGLLAGRPPIERLDVELIESIAREASRAGVGRDAAIALMERDAASPAELEALITRLDVALAGSPMPERELPELLRIYGIDGLASLLGTSAVSLRRYAAATRTVPDAVAARIHHVALVTSDLSGSYNEFGLRRWWERPRTALGGRSPREALGTGWDPDDPVAVEVAELARALTGPGSAT